MNKIRISDVTMKQTGPEISLSFREKIELSKLLDKLGVDIIELEPIAQPKIDACASSPWPPLCAMPSWPSPWL